MPLRNPSSIQPLIHEFNEQFLKRLLQIKLLLSKLLDFGRSKQDGILRMGSICIGLAANNESNNMGIKSGHVLDFAHDKLLFPMDVFGKLGASRDLDILVHL